MKKVPELFGSMVFNEAVMKERLPKDAYKALKQTIRQGSALDPQIGQAKRARPILPTGSSR